MAVAAAWGRLFDLRPGLVHLQMASFSFDVFTADVVRALGFGGRLVLCPRPLLLDSAGLYALLRRHDVDFADFVPAVLNPLLAHLESTGASLAGLRDGGLRLGRLDRRGRRPAARACAARRYAIVNAYGVTEAAVDSTWYVLPDRRPRRGDLPADRPAAAQRAGLPARRRRRAGPRRAWSGEIYIGGAGVARGYLSRPELTAERFVAEPVRARRTAVPHRRPGPSPAGRESGVPGPQRLPGEDPRLPRRAGRDRGPAGGRPGVREAVVVARPDAGGDQRLVAYVLAGSSAPDAAPAA